MSSVRSPTRPNTAVSPSDAFHVVLPRFPGLAFPDKPTESGWGLPRIARAWSVLMQRFGYTDLSRAGRRLGREHVTPRGWPNSTWKGSRRSISICRYWHHHRSRAGGGQPGGKRPSLNWLRSMDRNRVTPRSNPLGLRPSATGRRTRPAGQTDVDLRKARRVDRQQLPTGAGNLARRDARQHLTVLAHQHGRVLRAPLL